MRSICRLYRRGTGKRSTLLVFIASVVAIPFYILVVLLNPCNIFGGLPSFDVLENPNITVASELYSSDGVLLGKYFRYNTKQVAYKDLSPKIVNTLISTEDHNFFNHSGISLYGLLRAGLYSILLRKKTGGGSTLTQQLAKNLFQTRGGGYNGVLTDVPVVGMLVMKTKEWIVSVKLERIYSKEEIIAMYLNNVCFGNNTYGIYAASNFYFGVDQSELSYDQAALLVAILKGPSYYNPIRHIDRAKQRRNHVVLSSLLRYGYVTCDEYDAYVKTELDVKNVRNDSYNDGIAPYFRANVKNFLLHWAAQRHNYDLFSDGLKIYTTIDSRMQAYAEEAVREHMSILQKKFEKHIGDDNPWIDEDGNEIVGFIDSLIPKTDVYKELVSKYGDNATDYLHVPRQTKLFSWGGDIEVEISPYDEVKYNQKLLHTGMVAIDPYSGFVKSWVGGINYHHFKFDHVKQGKRQCGSAFKPFVYAAAIECGMSPDDIVYDLPVTFDMGPNVVPWTPKNSNNIYTGKSMTLRQALSRSVNSVTASLLKKYSPELVVDYAHKLGIKSYIKPVPSICLGCNDVSVLELTSAYCSFVNQGVWTQPICITRIEDKYGCVLARFIPEKREAIDRKTASQMIYMLRGSAEEKRGTFAGLASCLKADNEIGGKTGTTSNQSDGWTVGIVNKLCVGVWVGGDSRCIHFKDMSGQGATLARPIFEKFLIKLYNDDSLGYKKEKFTYG